MANSIKDIASFPGNYRYDEMVQVGSNLKDAMPQFARGRGLVLEYRPDSIDLSMRYADALAPGRGDPEAGEIVGVRRVPVVIDLTGIEPRYATKEEKFSQLESGLYMFAEKLKEQGFGDVLPVPKFLWYPGEERMRRGVAFVGEGIDIHPLIGTRYPPQRVWLPFKDTP